MSNEYKIEIEDPSLLLQKQKDKIDAHIKELQEKSDKLALAIKAVGGSTGDEAKRDKIPWRSLIFDLLKKEQRFLITNDITELLFPNSGDEHSLAVSQALASYVKQKDCPIVRVPYSGRGYRYGLREWIDSEGLAKEEYLKIV